MLYLKLSWGHGLSIFIGLQVDLLGLYMGYMKKRGQMAKSGRVVDSKAKYSPHLLLIVMLAAQQPSSLSRRRSINVESFQSCKHGKTESSQLGGLDQGAATTGSLLVLQAPLLVQLDLQPLGNLGSVFKPYLIFCYCLFLLLSAVQQFHQKCSDTDVVFYYVFFSNIN